MVVPISEKNYTLYVIWPSSSRAVSVFSIPDLKTVLIKCKQNNWLNCVCCTEEGNEIREFVVKNSAS